MNYLNPMLLCDFYKIAHKNMYPKGTQYIYSTWTPRASRITGVDRVVVFGIQAFLMRLNEIFNAHFFDQPKQKVINDYARLISCSLGDKDFSCNHISDLHDLGYLPLKIKALSEGTLSPIRMPILTIENTDERFFWLTNYIETLASCELWQATTSATIAFEYKKILDQYAMDTVGNTEFVKFQGHDFSMRGMSSLQSAVSSGMGHLLSFVGTDTIPAIQALEYFYGANIVSELVGTSIPASEHSIQCAYENDELYFDTLISKVHPSGMVSIVSDGYDFWDVISRVIPSLKEKIMSRDGKVVIRPDSGDPVKIICGDIDSNDPFIRAGAVECLWNIFGGTITDKGYKFLDSHIGLIYGDSITLDRAKEIVATLKDKGFASINVVFGIGSFTYQYNTRDTFGFALKTTSAIINGIENPIFKNPKTDDGTKKSQKGRVRVFEENGKMCFIDELNAFNDYQNNLLKVVYLDGKIFKTNIHEIRKNINTCFLSFSFC